MGAGKRSGPGERITGKGLTETEVYAELVHNGVSLAQIACLTDTQIKELYFRPRDEYGRLKGASKDWDRQETDCPKTKDWQKLSFTEMFKHVWRNRGRTEEEVEAQWNDYVNDRPSLKERVERANKVRQMMGR